MDKIEIIKKASLLVVGMGVGNVVANVANDAAPDNSKGITKAVTWVGVVVLSYIAVSKVREYMEPKIDGVIDSINKFIKDTKDEIK